MTNEVVSVGSFRQAQQIVNEMFLQSIIPPVKVLVWISSWLNMKVFCMLNVWFISLEIQQAFYKSETNTPCLLDLLW